ncbi:hypothetical protein B0A49_04490 [Cryomyces minteri]|uniref:Sterigmatocystin biosynthesis monooxygenase stcW n=1 Tax=Cryomyces minteri TaxID=331657 RepID=A0A4U0WYP0_9PEZI|nr:hypothetical protein B0A49_04490 [Cryomyces minteri]
MRPSNWVPVLEQAVYTPTRKLRMVVVGAGYSGLMMAHKIKYQENMSDYIDLKIYEKNGDVGGTWLENRYPGVACDVPAHIYTFSFEPNPDWSSFYAQGPEIWEYIKRTTEKYHLDENVEFNSKVVVSMWDETSGKWKIQIDQNGKIINDEADILVNGSGILNKWRWPEIEGFRDFQGKILHSAAWDPSYDWSGKRVAVIGNGSSAIQIAPQIQRTAAKVVNYIRSATWVSANFSADFTKDGKNFTYTEEEKQRFRDHPEELYDLRKKIEHGFNKFFYALQKDSPEQAAVYDIFKGMMKERLKGDEELCAKLIPDWGVGCRRLTPGDGYLEALQEKNCMPCFHEIVRFTEKGIETQEGVEEFDLIICATGFDVSFCPYWKLKGRNGRLLEREWSDNPEAYFGICAADHPNYFIFNGPNCPVGHGSLLAVMEWTAEYILRWTKKIAIEDIRSVSVRSDAVDDYNVYSQEFLKRTVWTTGCRSWYKNGKVDGKVTAMYAGSILHYKEILDNIRGEDFEIDYNSKNRFRFMGNGMTQREERGDDLSFYVYK